MQKFEMIGASFRFRSFHRAKSRNIGRGVLKQVQYQRDIRQAQVVSWNATVRFADKQETFSHHLKVSNHHPDHREHL